MFLAVQTTLESLVAFNCVISLSAAVLLWCGLVCGCCVSSVVSCLGSLVLLSSTLLDLIVGRVES